MIDTEQRILGCILTALSIGGPVLYLSRDKSVGDYFKSQISWHPNAKLFDNYELDETSMILAKEEYAYVVIDARLMSENNQDLVDAAVEHANKVLTAAQKIRGHWANASYVYYLPPDVKNTRPQPPAMKQQHQRTQQRTPERHRSQD